MYNNCGKCIQYSPQHLPSLYYKLTPSCSRFWYFLQLIFLVAPWAWPTHSGISSGKRRHLFHLFANAYIGIVYQLSFIGSRYTVQLSQIDCQIKFRKRNFQQVGFGCQLESNQVQQCTWKLVTNRQSGLGLKEAVKRERKGGRERDKV